MGMMKEFKEFAVKGNVIDMAVGIVIGGGIWKNVFSFFWGGNKSPGGGVFGGNKFFHIGF